MKAKVSGATIRITCAPSEKAGDHIGRYKLLQQIGEGGCGVVYMAQQEEPVRRQVALKIIKLGMDTKNVIARFESERQALALKDHPNVAKVFDAGATDTGRPFFVMELVRGIKVTEYCDKEQLSTGQRLDLFIQVCQAIQHAHQKGLIHRDIKPSNILVTLRDGVPVPKVIDFGIAKATTDQVLTDKTVFTEFQQFLGTPAYMSPEQAEMSELRIDTRRDIYSLGILLYELLTGKTPFEAKRLVATGLDEIRRIIREEEPLRPSTRLHTLDAAEQTKVAKHRQCEGQRLFGLIRGDLDWIVMRCLEKDRTRRYETANAGPSLFSADERWYFTLDFAGGRFLARDMATGLLSVQTKRSLEIEDFVGIATSPDGKLFAAGSVHGFIRLFDRATLQEVDTLRGFLLEAAFSVCFSPDGKRLAAGTGGREAGRLWEREGRQQLLTLEAGFSGSWLDTRFSPDGNLIGSVTANVLHLWRAPAWEEIQEAERTAAGPRY